jgi:hypothetical protein
MYNSSNQAEWNDMTLQDRMQDEFGISKGDFNIQEITTRTKSQNMIKGYGMTSDGYYVNPNKNELIGGFARQYSGGATSVHVAPRYAMGNAIDFRAIAGHELVHAYHYYTIPCPVSHLYTERVAHQYTYSVYMNSSRIATAMLQLGGMLSNAYAGSYPAQYSIPLIFKFSF